MTLLELREKLVNIVNEGRPIRSISEEIDLSPMCLSDFLKGKKRPRYATILRMKEFIRKEEEKNGN